MMLKTVTGIGAVVALLASSTAFADTAAKPSAKQVSQIMQLSRAHKQYGTAKSNLAGTPLIIIGVAAVGVGAAAAAGAFGSS